MYTVRELAELYGVTTMAVRHWIKAGCPYEIERVIGVKTRMVLDKEKVDAWLNLKPRRS